MNKATFLHKMLEAFYRMAHQGTQNNYDYYAIPMMALIAQRELIQVNTQRIWLILSNSMRASIPHGRALQTMPHANFLPN